jgi:hypothetical protein
MPRGRAVETLLPRIARADLRHNGESRRFDTVLWIGEELLSAMTTCGGRGEHRIALAQTRVQSAGLSATRRRAAL